MANNTVSYNREYYLKNKERILQKIKEKSHEEIMCDICQVMVRKTGLTSHKRTKLHKYIADKAAAAAAAAATAATEAGAHSAVALK